MSVLLGRLAAACTRRPRTVVAAWLIAVIAIVAASAGVSSKTGGDAALPGTDSAAAAALVAEGFPGDRSASSPLVLHGRSAEVDQGTLDRTTAALGRTAGVASATTLRRSQDGRTALVDVDLAADPSQLTEAQARTILDAARDAAGPGVEVEASGPVGQKLSTTHDRSSELVGMIAAIVVLLAVGGTVPSMLLPIATALLALVGALRVIALIGSATSLPAPATTLATMIGLGVGIDYALFLLTRMRGFRADGLDWPEAVRRAATTTGSAVVFAAATVAVALGALVVAGIPLVTKLGYCAGIAVVFALAAALTLLPALAAWSGDRLERLRVRRHRVAGESAGWRRWAAGVARAPWRALIASLALLALLAAPAATLTLGSARPSDQPRGTTQYKAYRLSAAAFGAGASSPLTVVARLPSSATSTQDPRIATLRADLKVAPGVAAVGAPRLSADGRVVAVAVTPAGESGSQETADLVHALRDDVLPRALPGATTHVGNSAALPVDLAATIAGALPAIIGVVVALSCLLLLVAFRSVVLPVKAAAMNLLSVAAAYGVLTAVFQHGWGASLIGLDGPVPVVSYVPMILFAVLFGLSMDYEVLLLSRVQEAHHDGQSTRASVVTGLAATGRLITAAALIMTCVFASFAFSADPTIRMFGVGLAAAIVIDATIVRCLLVPAAMVLMGRANWWMPAPLVRILER